MRCAHVIPYMNMRAGGPVVVVDRFCRQMARHGVESIVLTTDVLGEPDGQIISGEAAGEGPSTGTYELRCHRAFLGTFGYSPTLATSLDECVPTCDLVHVHTLWTYATWAAVRACRRHGVPYVLMPHGMLDRHSLARKPLRKTAYGHLFEFARARAAAAMIYTTDAERELAEASVRDLPEGHIVPLAADPPPDERAALAQSFLASRPHLADKHVVTFLGRVHPKKGLDLLIPAFAKVAMRVPNSHLLVIGPDNDGYWPRIQQQIDGLGLRPYVTRIEMLRGQLKWAALAASQLFVLPSHQENFAIAVAEALRIGTPVVISDRVNIWPTVARGGAGRVVPRDLNSLVDALLASLEDPVAWRAMSEAAVSVACECFDWRRSADAMMRVYEQVVERRAARMVQPAPMGRFARSSVAEVHP
ncbi:MAG: glycosyltransferase [Phycisphaerae bacterium]|nr:glycosyltransferase [Phycisphaerae bacterium]